MFREYIDPGTWRVNSAGLDECKSMFSTLTILICSIALFILPYWMWLGLRTPGGRDWVVTERSLSPLFSSLVSWSLKRQHRCLSPQIREEEGDGRKENRTMINCPVSETWSFPWVAFPWLSQVLDLGRISLDNPGKPGPGVAAMMEA